MRFADLADVNARAAELTRVITAWCALAEPQDAAPKRKPPRSAGHVRAR